MTIQSLVLNQNYLNVFFCLHHHLHIISKKVKDLFYFVIYWLKTKSKVILTFSLTCHTYLLLVVFNYLYLII